jgi:hypothetical protein
MTYGGIPHDELLRKMETTSMPPGTSYDDYARGEIMDWGPDKPFLDSDQPRNNTALSTSILNLRHKGTRGSSAAGPRNSESMLGFTKAEGPGSALGPPIQEIRKQMEPRIRQLTVRMGDNSSHHQTERQWSGREINAAMQEVRARQKENSKIFTAQKIGQIGNVNVDTGGLAGRKAMSLSHGDESLKTRAAVDTIGKGNALLDAMRWKSSTKNVRHDTTLAVQQYGQSRTVGALKLGADAQGGGRAKSFATDQAWGIDRQARNTNRQALVSSMKRAIQASKNGGHEHLPGVERVNTTSAGLTPGTDVQMIYSKIIAPITTPYMGNIQEGEHSQLGGASGLKPGQNIERATRSAIATTTNNTHLTNSGGVNTGLKQGLDYRATSGLSKVERIHTLNAESTPIGHGVQNANSSSVSQKTQISVRNAAMADGMGMNQYRAANPMQLEHKVSEAQLSAGEVAWREHLETTHPGRSAILKQGTSAVSKKSDVFIQTAAADGAETNVYKSANAQQLEHRVENAQSGSSEVAWKSESEAPSAGVSKKAGEWKSATQGQTKLGDKDGRTFGSNGEDIGYGRPSAPSVKKVRPSNFSKEKGDFVEF